MNMLKKKWKGAFTRSRSSCRPISRDDHGAACTDHDDHNVLYKTRSWPATPTRGRGRGRQYDRQQQLAPHGCFSVYVGQERRRFVVGIKHASHPLFKMLLEDAELEYGYTSEGPLVLPCDVDLFYRVLAEMENDDDDDGGHDNTHPPPGCVINFSNYGNGSSSCYSPLSPSKLLRMNS
ncbi:hypothetical protein Dimus_023676 [Dionaea muscipula]